MSRRERQSIYDASYRRKILPEAFEQTSEPSGIIGGLGEEMLNTFPASPKPAPTKEYIVTGKGKPRSTEFRCDLELE